MVDYVADALFIKTNYGRKRRFRPRAGRQSRATRKYRIMLEDPLGAARGRAGRPSHIRDKKVRQACQERACKSARAPAPRKRLCFADSERDDFRRPQVGPDRRHECASGEPVRVAGRVWRPGPDSGGTHGSIKPSGGRFGAVAAPRRRFPCARGAA